MKRLFFCLIFALSLVSLSLGAEAENSAPDPETLFQKGKTLSEAETPDLPAAFECWRQAAELGHAEAMAALARCFLHGEGVTQNDAEGVKWLRKAAELEEPVAMSALGARLLLGKGVEKNLEESVRWTRKAAEKGDATAQFNLGMAFLYGIGVPKDEAEGFRWFQKAAEQNETEAQFIVFRCLMEGVGTEKNEAEARKWLRKAAEQENALAQQRLGAWLLEQSDAENQAEGVKWTQAAAEKGDAAATRNLGACFLYEIGMAKDETQALKWIRKAASLGESGSQLFMAKAFFSGDGVPKDLTAAKEWAQRAVESGNAEALTWFQRNFPDSPSDSQPQSEEKSNQKPEFSTLRSFSPELEMQSSPFQGLDRVRDSVFSPTALPTRMLSRQEPPSAVGLGVHENGSLEDVSDAVPLSDANVLPEALLETLPEAQPETEPESGSGTQEAGARNLQDVLKAGALELPPETPSADAKKPTFQPPTDGLRLEEGEEISVPAAIPGEQILPETLPETLPE